MNDELERKRAAALNYCYEVVGIPIEQLTPLGNLALFTLETHCEQFEDYSSTLSRIDDLCGIIY